MFSRLEISMVLTEFFHGFNGIFSLSCRGKYEWYFLECLLTLSNVYEKVKTFEIIKSRKPRGNTGNSFGLKMFLFCINI